MTIKLIKIIFLLFLMIMSNVGIWIFIYNKTNINKYFLPMFSISIQILILYTFGLLNLLLEASLFIYIFGLFFFVYCFFVKSKTTFRTFDLHFVSIIIFMILLLLIILVTKNVSLYQDGDFHHWALIVKQLIKTNHLSTSKDEVITFKTYVPGTALYIYYWARFTANIEKVYLLAQNFMTFCFLLPMLALNRKKCMQIDVLVCVLFSNVICYNNNIFSLHVDVVLPCLAIAILIYLILGLKNNGYDRSRFINLQIMITSMLLLKNSAIFFFAIILMIELLLITKERTKWSAKIVFMMLSPLSSLFLWRKHCLYVFDNPDKPGIATVSINYFKIMSQAKTKGDCVSIANKLIKYTIQSSIIWKLAIIIIVYILAAFILHESRRKILIIVNTVLVCYFAWLVGMYITYIISIPYSDALRIGSADRYISTILIFIKLFIVTEIINMVNKVFIDNTQTNRNRTQFSIVSAMVVFAVCVVLFFEQNIFAANPEISLERAWLKDQINDYNVKKEKSYFVIGSDNGPINSERLLSILQYELYTTHFSYENDPHTMEQLDRAQNLEYIFIVNQENGVTREWLSEYYPDQKENKVIVTTGEKH